MLLAFIVGSSSISAPEFYVFELCLGSIEHTERLECRHQAGWAARMGSLPRR